VYAAQEFRMNCLEPGGGQTAFGEEFTLYANSPSDSIDTSGKGGEA